MTQSLIDIAAFALVLPIMGQRASPSVLDLAGGQTVRGPGDPRARTKTVNFSRESK